MHHTMTPRRGKTELRKMRPSAMIEPRALTQALNDAGIDPEQFHKDLEESGDAFANQFKRDDPNFHGGNTTVVPTGGSRVPESMGGAAAGDWRELPENQIAIE